MKYKLFISDYDGTLGSAPKNGIDSQTLSAIKEFQKKGGKFVVCTGRMFSSIQRICKKAHLGGLAVAFQGAVIRDIESGDFLLDGGLSPSQAISVVDEFINEQALPLIYIDEKLYYQQDESAQKYTEYIKTYTSMLNIVGIKVDSLKDELTRQNKIVSKACALCEPEKVIKIVEKLNENYKNTDIMFNSGAKYLVESINKKFNKGTAVRFLAEYYGVKLDEVITVGDSTNDIPLIDGEWHGVAVGDAKEQLKLKAKEITVPFNDKPILHLLNKYCLQ